jgi:hypothetical protein
MWMMYKQMNQSAVKALVKFIFHPKAPRTCPIKKKEMMEVTNQQGTITQAIVTIEYTDFVSGCQMLSWQDAATSKIPGDE